MKITKKLTSTILSVRDFAEGVYGTVGELRQLQNYNNEPVKGTYGQDLYALDLVNKHTGEITSYWADAGLRGTMKMAKVTAGQDIFIQHTGTKKIDEGTVQTYDIFGVEY